MSSSVNFYTENGNRMIAVARDVGGVPVVGHLVSIRKKTYVVTEVTWAVDNTESPNEPENLRANITLEKTT